MADRRFTVAAYLLGVVLAFSWGIYFVVLAQTGFDLGLFLGLAATTALVAAGFFGIWTLRRRTLSKPVAGASSQGDARFPRLLEASAIVLVLLWATYLVNGYLLGFEASELVAFSLMTVVLVCGDLYIWFEIFKKK